jgi:diguanylate cyclase (GGDEF)-like protein/PAS domain S-box-containing protein
MILEIGSMSMNDSIRLGIMVPLTGLAEGYGPQIVSAARIACDEINERGGILGRRLELIIEDDGSGPATAVPAAEQLIGTHRCVGIVGSLLSNSRIAIASQVAEPKRIPYLNFSFYEGSIASRYFFHFAALPNQQIDKMIAYMARHFGLKMFFAGNNYEWPRGSIDAGKRALSRLGGEVVGEEYLTSGDSAGIDRLLRQLERSGADVFLPFFAGEDQINLLTRFTEMGLKKRMAAVTGRYDELIASRLRPQVREGFYSSNTYFMSLDTPENRHYLQRLGRQPDIDGIWPRGKGMQTSFGEGAHLCVHAFAKAAEAAGTTDAEALVEALEHVSVSGPQGVVAMDAATHHASVHTYLARCELDGTFSIVERFGCNLPQIPDRYREQMQAARLHEAPVSPRRTFGLETKTSIAGRKIVTAEQIMSLADTAILATDAQGTIVESSRRACTMFGYGDGELAGLSMQLLLPPNFRQRHVQLIKQFIESADTERRIAGPEEIVGYRKDGSIFPLEASIAKAWNDGEWLLLATLRDITEHTESNKQLARNATHDLLTGLPNRRLIFERVASALQRSRRDGRSVALLLVDLDGFKMLKGTHGHAVGNLLLKSVANRLIDQVRPGDTVARLSDDEFVVFCEQVGQPAAMSVLAERINVALRPQFDLDGIPLFLTASVGVAIGHGSTHSADDLLLHADAAAHAVKGKGRDGWQFFSAELQEQAKQRLLIRNGLRTAIERGELSTRFQPLVVAESGRIVGAELLLRWNPPEGGVSPAVFIPVAEMTGAIVPIGAWVFQQACQAEVDWRRRWGKDAPYVSVNVSARQLNQESLAQDFAATLRETGADPTRLILEITETSLMADVEANLRILIGLTDLGLRVAVDDFGTGYSSLAQLTRLPVSVLKIDRAFVDGIERSAESRAVVRAVISLGRALGLKLVAEGVETEAQQSELSASGCDFIQGYYFHRPLEEKVFIETVERERHDNSQQMATSLYFLIYVSQAVQAISLQDLEDLLSKSHTFNRSAGLTGCLIHQDGYFLQMLEGEQKAVSALMEKIKVDPRHHQVRIAIEGPTRHRVFTDWGMAMRDLSARADAPNFSAWQRRPINFLDLADDARICYSFVTAYAQSGDVS